VTRKLSIVFVRFSCATGCIAGVNLLTFTKYSGYDPEARRDDAGVGEEFYSAPPAKTIALGVNINFKFKR
jgi:hypothetical protein